MLLAVTPGRARVPIAAAESLPVALALARVRSAGGGPTHWHALVYFKHGTPTQISALSPSNSPKKKLPVRRQIPSRSRTVTQAIRLGVRSVMIIESDSDDSDLTMNHWHHDDARPPVTGSLPAARACLARPGSSARPAP
jgi:hypothetical protein